MGLKNMSLLSGSTVSFTGGSPFNFVDDGVSIANGLRVTCVTDADYTTRRSVTFKVRPAARDAKTGKYTKDKKSITLACPMLLTDGSVVFNTLRIERELNPLATTGAVTAMMEFAAQFLYDADLAGFWQNGSLS